MKRIMKTLLTCVALAGLFCTVSTAQDADKAAMAKLAGTWKVDLEKTLELIDDETQREAMREGFAGNDVRMIFGKDGSVKMLFGEMAMEEEQTFTLKAVEDADNQYSITISGGPSDMKGTVEFLDKNTVKVTPESDMPAVLVREVKVYKLEEAKKMFLGKWVANEEATMAMYKEKGIEPGFPGGSLPDVSVNFTGEKTVELGEGGRDPMKVEYTVEAGEKDNEFSISLIGGPQDLTLIANIIDEDNVEMKPTTEDSSIILSRDKD